MSDVCMSLKTLNPAMNVLQTCMGYGDWGAGVYVVEVLTDVMATVECGWGGCGVTVPVRAELLCFERSDG